MSIEQHRLALEKLSASYLQVLLDCQKKDKLLTEWEMNFIHSLMRGFESNHLLIRRELSPKQEAVLRKIERKVYSA